MFNFETPYLDMYMTQHFKFKSKPTVLHQKTCPICERKLVNVYYSSQLEKYICKNCMDKLLRERRCGVMAKYKIKAYGEEYDLPNKSKVIEAKNKAEAEQMAWCIFGEYEDISVSEVDE